MPELPDIVVYQEALAARIVTHALERVRILNPFLLRTADPPIASVEGRSVTAIRRLGKRVVIALEGERFLVLHLMRAGRLRWLAPKAKPAKKITLAIFEFANGHLAFTEAGTKRRASLHLVQGEAALQALDPGGLEVLDCDLAAFAARLTSERHTLKRALTAPSLFSGIGAAYSDEILFRARLAPTTHTTTLKPEAIECLYTAARAVLSEWIGRLREAAQGEFPEGVTAFREEMCVHGRFGKPCKVCGDPIQRIVYAETETNYCAQCQTGGRLLADRALSRLLHESWPKFLE